MDEGRLPGATEITMQDHGNHAGSQSPQRVINGFTRSREWFIWSCGRGEPPASLHLQQGLSFQINKRILYL